MYAVICKHKKSGMETELKRDQELDEPILYGKSIETEMQNVSKSLNVSLLSLKHSLHVKVQQSYLHKILT